MCSYCELIYMAMQHTKDLISLENRYYGELVWQLCLTYLQDLFFFSYSEETYLTFPLEHLYVIQIEAITRRILYIRSSDPEAKVLVFSSWNDVLDVLEHALEVNNITYIRMKGGRCMIC